MSDISKLEILKAISADALPGKVERFSFNTLGKNLQLTKDQLDTYLTELNNERFVAQYAKKGVDSFTVEMKQKGLDAVEDASVNWFYFLPQAVIFFINFYGQKNPGIDIPGLLTLVGQFTWTF